jgi:hypothetical protein
MGQVLPFFLVGAAIVAYFFWSRYRKQQRSQAFARFAARSGLQYWHDDPYNLLEYDFPLLREGDGRGCENVLAGRWQDLPVKEADYWYYTTTSNAQGGSSRDYSYFSIVIADLAATMPYVAVRKESLFTKLAGHLGFHDIEFESEDFNREFRVKASDKEFAFKLIDARMMQWLLSTGGRFAFEVRGSSLLVSCHRLPPTGLVPLFDAAQSFTDHVPHLVWAEYGTGQQTPSTAEPPGEPPAKTDGGKSTS